MEETALKVENLSIEAMKTSFTLRKNEILGIYSNHKGKKAKESIMATASYSKIKFGYVPGETSPHPTPYLNLTVKENLEFFALAYGLKERKKRAEDILNFLEIDEHANTLVKHLKAGLRRKVILGIAIIHKPNALIVDEPCDLWGIIERLKPEMGILIFTRNLSELERCDRVIVITDTVHEFKPDKKDCILIRPFKMEKAMKVLDEFGFRYAAFESGIRIWVDDSSYAIPEIVEMFLRRGIKLERVEIEDRLRALAEIM